MVKQYPHTLKLTVAVTSTQDESGDWVVDDDPQSETIKCRAEPSSGNVVIETSDGRVIRPDWVVYMPLPVDCIKEGTALEIIDENGDSLGIGTVKRFSRGQLNARIWV